MVTRQNRCVGCDGAGYPCNLCGLDNAVVFICDCCGEEMDKLYWLDGEQLCEDCVLDRLQEVEADE